LGPREKVTTGESYESGFPARVPTTPATVIVGSSGYPADICGVLGGAHITALDETHDVVAHKFEFAGEPTGLHSPIRTVDEGLTDPKFAPRNVRKYVPWQDGKLYGRLFVNVGASKLKTAAEVW